MNILRYRWLAAIWLKLIFSSSMLKLGFGHSKLLLLRKLITAAPLFFLFVSFEALGQLLLEQEILQWKNGTGHQINNLHLVRIFLLHLCLSLWTPAIQFLAEFKNYSFQGAVNACWTHLKHNKELLKKKMSLFFSLTIYYLSNPALPGNLKSC